MMKQNKYDDEVFFAQYSKMTRSVQGLSGAGEWHELQKLLPALENQRVLDLGCGFGWHCMYAAQQGAKSIVGVDISEKMLAVARKKAKGLPITYVNMPIEDISYPTHSFDVVISSLTFHYIADFADIVKKVDACLVHGGKFVFSVEHPVFTAYGTQDWYYNQAGERLHFPVDNYYSQGQRTATFLGEQVIKYHKTLTTYLNTLLQAGFMITGIVEPQPSQEMLDTIAQMKDELRRPMMLIVSAEKK